MSRRPSTDAVLVVTRVDDVTADLVVDELNRRAVPVVRLDPGDFPDHVVLDAHFTDGGLTGCLHTATRSLDLDSVRSVYWRRPSAYSVAQTLPTADADWCAEQARYGLGGVLSAFPTACYVNRPQSNRAAEYKPAQLRTAASQGLRLPPTLVTNDAERARAFAAEHEPVIYKPLWNSAYQDQDGRALTVWVEEVRRAQIDSGVRATAHLFQARVDKEADLRVTAVGDELTAVRIDGATGLDWRRSYDTLAYSEVPVPPRGRQGHSGIPGRFRPGLWCLRLRARTADRSMAVVRVQSERPVRLVPGPNHQPYRHRPGGPTSVWRAR